MGRPLLLAALGFLAGFPGAAQAMEETRPAAISAPAPLSWGSKLNEYYAKPGETEKVFTFDLSNASARDVTVTSVVPSCGCTMVELPPLPWRLASGEKGRIEAKMDWTGRYGLFAQTITVETEEEPADVLTLKIHIPEPDGTSQLPLTRARNLQAALADRQAVFKNDCAKCHAEPAANKTGQSLYAAACGICHDAGHRAAVVPDLRGVSHPADAAYWRRWIAHGKAGSLMPAFAQSEGGPLTEPQIDSLVAYLISLAQRPSRPAAPGAATN